MLEICTDSSYFGQTAQPLGRYTPAITEIDLPVCRQFGKIKAALDVPSSQAVPVPVLRAGAERWSWVSFATDTGLHSRK